MMCTASFIWMMIAIRKLKKEEEDNSSCNNPNNAYCSSFFGMTFT
uniref:Uncharacterized protein n=1 Tax=Rhizophora mucronata TaxID=61149 RepID=A0A2P2PX78_RHIMU